MTLKLTGRNEEKGKFQEFHGRPTEQMPKLIKAGYMPMSVSGVIGRRETAPTDVIDGWRRNYFFTGDCVVYGGRKNVKLVLDAEPLCEITPKTKLDNYAAVLSVDQWENLHGDNVLYLSEDKIEQAHRKGFVKKSGVWQPENTVVGDVWEHLSRGWNLQNYADMVHEASGSDRVMWLWFDGNKYSSPVMRSLVVGSTVSDSLVGGDLNLNNNSGRFVGVAPEALEERIKSGPKEAGKNSVYRGLMPSPALVRKEIRPWYGKISDKFFPK